MLSSRRQDIQGIRGICVLAVLFYHAKLGFRFGFLGVDMFMVVSGYVVGGVVLREYQETGSFKYRYFLARRVRRLYPTLLLVVGVTWIIFSLAAPLGLRRALLTQGLSAVLGIANLYFASQASDYFALGGGFQPFLHTWSLAVEEQFYLLLALGTSLAIFLRRRYLTTDRPISLLRIAALLAISLLVLRLSLLDLGLGFAEGLRGVIPEGFSFLTNPRLDFYSPIHRGWQFILGIAAVIASPRATRTIRASSSWALILVGLMCLSVDVGESAPIAYEFRRLIVSILTATLLLVRPTSGGYGRVLTWIGDRSYAIYLWHYPALELLGATGESTPRNTALMIFFVFVLSHWTYRYVESPYRLSQSSPSQLVRAEPAIIDGAERRVLSRVGVVLLLSGFWLTWNPAKYLEKSEQIAEASRVEIQTFLETHGCKSTDVGQAVCGSITPNGVLLLGDSQAWSLAPGFILASESSKVELAVRARAGCLPIPANSPINPASCETQFGTSLSAELSESSPATVVLLMCARLVGDCPGDVVASSVAQLAETVADGLADSLPTRTRILLVDSLPLLLHHPASTESAYFKIRYGDSGVARIDSEKMAVSAKYLSALSRILRSRGYSVEIVDIFDPLCKSDTCEVLSSDGSEYAYLDNSHLSLNGSVALVDQITPIIASSGELIVDRIR